MLLAGACSQSDDEARVGAADASDDTTTATADSSASSGADDSVEIETGSEDAPPSASVIEFSAVGSDLAPMVADVLVVIDRPVSVGVTARSGDHVVSTPRTAAQLDSHRVPVVGMRADRAYDVVVEMFDRAGESVGMSEVVSFTTPPLPDWIPDHAVTVDAARTSPGYTIVETSPKSPPGSDDDVSAEDGSGDDGPAADEPSRALLIAYDDAGEIVWYYSNTGGLGAVEQTSTGTFLSNYWPFGMRETDVLGNVVGNWSTPPWAASSPAGQPSADDDAFIAASSGNPGDPAPIAVDPEWIDLISFHHENWPMPDGNVLALSTTIHELTDEQRQLFCPGDAEMFNVISDVVVEFEPDGTVLRTWDLWDAVDVEEIPGVGLCETTGQFATVTNRDWTHANSAVYDESRDAILVSSRHTDQIIALDYGESTGPQTGVRWILGADATMPLAGDLTYHQHAVEVLDDGAIVVYDNGNHRPGTSVDDESNPPYSRAVIFDVDDRDTDMGLWTATQLWEHRIDDDEGRPVYTEFIGDADVLANGNVLITHGGIGALPADPADPWHALIIEVDPDAPLGDDIVWRFESDPSEPHAVYRSERIESFYVGDDWVVD